MPVHVDVHVEASRADPSGAIWVTVTGCLELSGAAAEWIVRSPTPDYVGGVREVRTTVSLMAPESAVEIPSQTVRGTVADPTTLWLQFVDGQGRRLGGSGLSWPSLAVPPRRSYWAGHAVTATAVTRLAPRPMGRLEACGTLRMAGLGARLALSGDVLFASDRLVSGPFSPRLAVLTDVAIIPTGETIATARQPVPNYGPQDSWLWVQWRHGNGAPSAPSSCSAPAATW